MDKEEIGKNIKKSSTWLRGFYMIVMVIAYGLAEIAIAAVIVFQFISVLLFNKANERLIRFAHTLNKYIYQILCYLSFTSEEIPFPFSEWPHPDQ